MKFSFESDCTYFLIVPFIYFTFMVYCETLLPSQTVQRWTAGWLVGDEVGRIWEWPFPAEVLHRNLSSRTEKNHE